MKQPLNTPLLLLDSVGKIFPHPFPTEIFKEISFSLYPEETLAIVGPSGSGKSTLLHLIASLEKVTTGTIFIEGIPLNKWSIDQLRREMIGLIFQNYNLLEDATSIENVLLPAKIARKATGPKSSSYKRALCLLESVGLKSRSKFPVKFLSGGEKQRVAIARSLINNPKILLADEPTGNLDHHHSEEIATLLFSIAKKEKKALIIVTHDTLLAKQCQKTHHLL